jgi:DNA-binding CsgD family transcriptional regulator
MRCADRIEIIEAAYGMHEADEAWQRRLTELVARQWDGEASSLVFDASNPEALVRESFITVTSEEKRALFEAGMSVPVPAAYVDACYRRAPYVSSIYEVLESMGTQVDEYGPLRTIRDASPRIEWDYFSHGIRTLDPSHKGLSFCLSARPITEPMRRVWGQLAAHIGIAHRLRRKLAGLAAPSSDPLGEAIVDLDGRCHHAEGEARSVEAREILRDASRRVMRARSSLRSRDPDEAIEIWQGLVNGRWSLVDRFDSDGKHYLVAHRNPPQVRDHRALSQREAQVAAYVAIGLSSKAIAYALGITTTTTADHVASIERKLGTRSRTELVRLLAAFGTTTETSELASPVESDGHGE